MIFELEIISDDGNAFDDGFFVVGNQGFIDLP